MQSMENNESSQNGGGGTRDVLTSSGDNYGPAAAHAASIVSPVLFFFIGAWISGFLWFSFIAAIALALVCWGAALYARRRALSKTPPDNYGAFQYKQAVIFGVGALVGTELLQATIIFSIVATVALPIATGYTLYGAYQVARGRDFRYAIVGRRLSG